MVTQFFLKEGRLTSFGAVLAPRVAGWHDGTKATLDFDYVNNAVAFHHEEAHETLFRKTPDGILTAVLCRLLDSGLDFDAGVRTRVEVTAHTLFAASTVAHETAATYLGIKTADPEVGEQALRLLPDEYQRHYRAAADVIDPHFRSTHLQVSVLSTLAHCAFASTLMGRYVAQDWPAYRRLLPADGPNWRLDTLLSMLDDGKYASLKTAVERGAEDAFAGLGIVPWDIHCDEGWERAPTGTACQVELLLHSVIEAWIFDQGVMDYLDYEARHQALELLAAKAGQLGLALRVEPRGSEPDMRSAAQRQGGSLVSNSARLEFPRWEKQALWECAADLGGPQLILLHPDPFTADTDWTVFVSGPKLTRSNCLIGERRCWGARVATQDVMAWLDALADAGQDMPQTLSPSLIVLAYPQYQGPIYSKWADHTLHYLVENWATLMEAGLRSGPMTVTELEVGVPGSTFALHMARSEALLGCTFRALAQQASTAMGPLELQWRESPNYTWLSSEEAHAADFDLAAVTAAFMCIMAAWSAF